MTALLGNKLHLGQGKIEGLDEDYRWAPVAHEAGFQEVRFCKSWHENIWPCNDLSEDYEIYQSTNLNHVRTV